MKLQSLMLRNSLLLLTTLLALPAFRAAAQSKPEAVGAATSQAPTIPARLTQAVIAATISGASPSAGVTWKSMFA